MYSNLDDLWLALIVVGVLSLFTMIALIRFLRHQTLLRFAVVLIAGVLALGFLQAMIPVLLRHCNQSSSHVDCAPDRFEWVVRGVTRLVAWILPSEIYLLAALVVTTVVAVGLRLREVLTR